MKKKSEAGAAKKLVGSPALNKSLQVFDILQNKLKVPLKGDNAKMIEKISAKKGGGIFILSFRLSCIYN